MTRASILARGAQTRLRRLASPLAAGRRLPRRVVSGLVIAPGDIRTADPTRAEDIYAGSLVFGGRMVSAEGRRPFDIPPPTADFARELAGFSWLRHMRAAGTALARSNARALIADFLAAEPRLRKGPAGEPAVAGRRILSWLAQAPFVLSGADAAFYQTFMRGLSRDAATVARRYGDAALAARLTAGIALTELALCADLGAPTLKRVSGNLADEIARQIFPDGGHINRDPQVLVDLLLDLLPLRQTFGARNQPAPPALLHAIDRMIPMLRLLRHGDGSLALFNGMSLTEPDHLATVLAYGDGRGRALLNAPHSGYQRLEGADAIVICDAGAPPPPPAAIAAHAGCLSFEFSAGRSRIVVNCGAPLPGKPSLRDAARQTAAHSTLVIDNVSSSQFATTRGIERILDGTIVAGPRTLTVDRREQTDATVLDLSHDGYAATFGLIHTRRLMLSRDGRQLMGMDGLVAGKASGQRTPKRFDIRFHLHPDVRVDGDATEEGLVLIVGGERISFDAKGASLSVEESVLFATPKGSQRTLQIVLSGDAVPNNSVEWSFTRPGTV